MKNTITANFVTADEKLSKLFVDLKKSFGHAGEAYRSFTDGYGEMRRNFGHTM